MATPNVRGAYELLRRAMQQQSLQQQGADFGSTPNAAPEDGSDSYGGPQGGLLGRWIALQAEQSRQQPFAGNNEPSSSEALDPNFRQLSRAPVAARPQGAIGPSNRPDIGRTLIAQALANQQPGNTGRIYSAGYGHPVLDDVSPDPVRPGSQHAQALGLCFAGPAGCVAGGGITAGQAILGGAAALLGGATILNQNKPSVPGNKPAGTPTDESSSEKSVVPGTNQPSDGGALIEGGDKENLCLDRWEGEYNSCDKFWRPYTTRFLDACRARAKDRLSLCYGNGGIPHPEEPAEYFWKNIPRDRLRR
jgi:hypothetical protein